VEKRQVLAHLLSELWCKVAYGGGGCRAGCGKISRDALNSEKFYYDMNYGTEEKRQKKDLGD
jgi:hypothetical protein